MRAQHEGRFGPLLESLDVTPFTHQVEAWDALVEGNNIVVATPTASGKSLVYQVPAFAALEAGETVLYLSPTKALTADQLLKRGEYRVQLGSRAVVGSYDGDTPVEERGRLRQEAAGLLTNPDMLHYGILPYNDKWAHFLARLRYLILDELHVYRGVFGVHVANLL